MEGRGREVAQLAVQQQLRAAYGIKVKTRAAKRNKPTRSAAAGEGRGKIFGIPLHELPQQIVPEYGHIPCFLVEACKYLEEHIHTEGLFRKSGSFMRLKTLKTKLDQGESGLSTAQPCDVAGLLKQFFRELPEPILPNELQEALIKAQQLNSEEKISATLLLSCLINERQIDTLRYFFKFLKNVSLRSAENKMDSSNLAVIFVPNLLQSSEPDKMTEKKLRLQAAVLQTFIDHADKIGHFPKVILEKIPALLGIDDTISMPSLQDCGENEIETPREHMRRRRQSIGDVVSGALNKFKSNRTPSTTPQKGRCVIPPVTPVIVTPNCKRKYPADSSQGFSSKKRRSIRHNMGLELLPNTLFSTSSTPGSVQFELSPILLEASQNSLSVSVTGESHLPSIGSRRSKRIASKKVQRADSGKMGCFSPKISRKEMVRRSLRLKFILGKSSKENTAMDHPASNRSENIGRRLASQQDKENGLDSVKKGTLLSPYVGSKDISKSEENLKIVKHNDASYRMSWTGPNTTESQGTGSRGTASMARCEVAASSSELALTVKELPVIPFKIVDARTRQDSNKRQTSLCEDENNVTTDTLLKIKKAFSESGSNLHKLFETESSKSNSTGGTMCFTDLNLERHHFKGTAQKMSNVEQKTLFTNSAYESSEIDKCLSSTDKTSSVEGSLSPNNAKTDLEIHELRENDGSVQEDQLITRTSPHLQLQGTSTLQKEILESTEQFSTERLIEVKEPIYCKSEPETRMCCESKELSLLLSGDGDRNGKHALHVDICEKSKLSPSGKVADHIHWFNKLSLNEPCSATKTKPPLKFQRTPVRHSIRKMNSLLEANKHKVTCKLMKAADCPSLVRSVSYETALSSCAESMSKTSTASSLPSEPTCKQMSTYDQFARSSKPFQQLIHPLEQASRPDTSCKETVTTANHSKSALEDLTNHEAPKTVAKMNTNINAASATPDKCVLRKTVEIKTRYRGSPKNPMATSKLLPVVKPLDL
ncbi:rho GTPase-activating protein 11A-like isoform X1 [Sceloporus undulatus]|uniref:rho GTPase-activating protein 11A-like isoform X1 n=1 Tax=Sceloporus undulatus TaxID=8520 RepID=UPI001C4CBE89|nr:rho GTPase-activating protein 11A-like isoform X1 [Sceloporus undulatus]